jgi:hypothetical protein
VDDDERREAGDLRDAEERLVAWIVAVQASPAQQLNPAHAARVEGGRDSSAVAG